MLGDASDHAVLRLLASAEAVVRDERCFHRGARAIRAWIGEATVGNQAVATPQAAQLEGDGHHVTAVVSGALAGSLITLTFHFRLGNGRIAELEIGRQPRSGDGKRG
ncbi:MAG: hypothetical protein QHC65_12105 [Sphingomonas sp.]|nr:hypothetical protein [Sphingomonas sp.]MDX3885159.1 hypothetical protein [Sphingomonas sp.]